MASLSSASSMSRLTSPAQDKAMANAVSSVYLITSDGRTLQLPLPSSSPKDPLSWSQTKRTTALGSMFFFTMLAVIQIQSLGILIPLMALDYAREGIPVLKLTPFASSSLACVGASAFIWIPLSVAIGRRPVFILANLLLALGSIYAAASPSFYHHVVAQSIQSVASGFTFSTIGLMMVDLTFIHQRIMIISIFWSFGATISNALIAPVPDLVVALGSWRGFYWTLAVLCFMSLIVAIFFCPETYFSRPPIAFDGHILVQSATEKTTIYDNIYAARFSDPEKNLPEIPASNMQLKLRELRLFGLRIPQAWSRMLAVYPQCLLCFFNPLVFWVMIMNALVTTGVLSFDLSYAVLLLQPPYGLSFRKIGLIKLCCAAGALLSFPISGLLSSRITRRLAHRNGGYHSAEHYLPSFIAPVISGFIAQVLYGYAIENKLHYGFLFASYGIMYFSFISLYTCNTLWAIEVFPCYSAASLAVGMGGSYMVTFGFSFAIKPWIEHWGHLKVHSSLGGLIFIFGSIGIPIAIFGKRLRIFIQEKYGNMLGGALRPQ